MLYVLLLFKYVRNNNKKKKIYSDALGYANFETKNSEIL